MVWTRFGTKRARKNRANGFPGWRRRKYQKEVLQENIYFWAEMFMPLLVPSTSLRSHFGKINQFYCSFMSEKYNSSRGKIDAKGVAFSSSSSFKD